MSIFGKAPPFTILSRLETMGLGLEVRTRANNYPEIIRHKSIYMQSNSVITTERTLGMPSGSTDNLVFRKTSAGAIQISSTSTNDTSAGTGAQTCLVEGLTNIDGVWEEISETFTMNGQTGVTSASSDWYRINKILVFSSGTLEVNDGDIYISETGVTLTAGLPPITTTMYAMIAGYSNSSMGCFSVGSNQGFQYTKGNFWIDPAKLIVIHETFFQDLSGGDDQTKYEVGIYPAVSATFDYTGAAPYTGKTDLCLSCFTESGTADAVCYYLEYVLTDLTKTNT